MYQMKKENKKLYGRGLALGIIAIAALLIYCFSVTDEDLFKDRVSRIEVVESEERDQIKKVSKIALAEEGIEVEEIVISSTFMDGQPYATVIILTEQGEMLEYEVKGESMGYIVSNMGNPRKSHYSYASIKGATVEGKEIHLIQY